MVHRDRQILCSGKCLVCCSWFIYLIEVYCFIEVLIKMYEVVLKDLKSV